jgi:thiamine-monophosphate kinase
MTIDADALPIDQAARDQLSTDGGDPVLAALTGGDDYELLFTVRPRQAGRLKTVSGHSDVPITCVGVCTSDPAVLLRRTVNGTVEHTPIPPGYSHFA